MSSPTHIRMIRRAGATLLLCGGLAAGSLAAASAASPTTTTTPLPKGPPGGPMARLHLAHLGVGKVTSFTATSLTISGPAGRSETFTLSPSTVYEKDGATASSSALAVGARVLVVPTASSATATTPTADRVMVSSPRLGGTVVSVSGASGAQTIVIEDGDGFYRTITTSAATTYVDDGKAVSHPAITVGSTIGALGAVDANHTTLDATELLLGTALGPGMGIPGFPGGPGGFRGGFPGAPGGFPGGGFRGAGGPGGFGPGHG